MKIGKLVTQSHEDRKKNDSWYNGTYSILKDVDMNYMLRDKKGKCKIVSGSTYSTKLIQFCIKHLQPKNYVILLETSVALYNERPCSHGKYTLTFFKSLDNAGHQFSNSYYGGHWIVPFT